MKKPLSKLDEIEILEHCAANLGSDSYCGPWLAAAIPEITDHIRSDFHPHPQTMRECMKACEAMTAEAKRYAKEIGEQAQSYASKTIADARKRADEIQHRAARRLNEAYNELIQ